MLEIIILTIVTLIIGGYFWWKRQHQFWKNRGVPYLKPESLIYGNFRDTVTGKLSLAEHTLELYNAMAPHKFFGIYNFHKPLLYVRDPELIKNVLIKDFHNFADHSFDSAGKWDPISLHLFNLYGEDWKNLRHKLTPVFTSGKMKLLFVFMQECVEKLEEIIKQSALDHEPIEVKNLMARYTTDVISSCAFGLEADSLHNPDSEFRAKGKAVFTPTLRFRLRDALLMLCPKLIPFLRFKSFPSDISNFFINLVKDTVEYRSKNGIRRNDFLDLLIDIKNKEEKSKHTEFTWGFLTAQCFIFFIAGFETSSNALSLIFYELAEHQDVQRKLQEEVDRVLKKHDGQITFDSLQDMHYMDQIINETTRLYPALPVLFRVCTKDYNFPDSDYVIKRGQPVFVPVYGLHRDPQYFPNPDAFNPENFSAEANASRPACCFLPFGDGPRICIGMRFGFMQIKLALTTIMREYTVTTSPKMKLPIEYLRNSLLVICKNDILINFNSRGSGQ